MSTQIHQIGEFNKNVAFLQIRFQLSPISFYNFIKIGYHTHIYNFYLQVSYMLNFCDN